MISIVQLKFLIYIPFMDLIFKWNLKKKTVFILAELIMRKCCGYFITCSYCYHRRDNVYLGALYIPTLVDFGLSLILVLAPKS